MTESRVRNDLFDASIGFDRGRGFLVFALWHVCRWAFFVSCFPWPSRIKVRLLRLFGASVGKGVYIKPRVSIHLPWKLSIGDYAWIGEEVTIVNFAPIQIGAHCCISQRAFLCSGNHDFRDPKMLYRNAPIKIGDGAWIGACAFIAPGVDVGVDCVVTACTVVLKSTPDGMVISGNPGVVIKPRWADHSSLQIASQRSMTTGQ